MFMVKKIKIINDTKTKHCKNITSRGGLSPLKLSPIVNTFVAAEAVLRGVKSDRF